MAVAISNSFYGFFCPILAPIANFIQIGWKTQKLKIFAIGRFWLVGLVGQKMTVAISNSFYVVFCPILAPIPNFIQIGWKTQKLKIFAIGRFWLKLYSYNISYDISYKELPSSTKNNDVPLYFPFFQLFHQCIDILNTNLHTHEYGHLFFSNLYCGLPNTWVNYTPDFQLIGAEMCDLQVLETLKNLPLKFHPLIMYFMADNGR